MDRSNTRDDATAPFDQADGGAHLRSRLDPLIDDKDTLSRKYGIGAQFQRLTRDLHAARRRG
jgi:hypothetical protein